MDLKTLCRAYIPNNVAKQDSMFSLDPANRNAEFALSPGDYVTGETTALFSGPPTLFQALQNTEALKPVGMCTGLQVQVNNNLIPWVELNARYARSIIGRTSSSLVLARLAQNHNSLLYSLYRWSTALLLTQKNYHQENFALSEIYSFSEAPGYHTAQADSRFAPGSKEVYMQNKSNRQFNNLGSEYFRQPFGLAILEMDQFYNIVGVMYAQNCKVTTWGKSYSGSNPVSENTQISCTNIVAGNGLQFATVYTTNDKYKIGYRDFGNTGALPGSSPVPTAVLANSRELVEGRNGQALNEVRTREGSPRSINDSAVTAREVFEADAQASLRGRDTGPTALSGGITEDSGLFFQAPAVGLG